MPSSQIDTHRISYAYEYNEEIFLVTFRDVIYKFKKPSTYSPKDKHVHDLLIAIQTKAIALKPTKKLVSRHGKSISSL